MGLAFSIYSQTCFRAGIHPPEKPTSSSSPSADSSRCKDLSQPFSELPSLLERFPGGIPTTHLVSGLQWDQPNAWPPLQYSTITALQRTSIEMSRLNCPTDHIESINLLAFQVAQTFINTTYCGWRFSGGFIPHLSLPKLLASQLHHEDVNGTLFEKYHVEHVGVSGHGGEYEPQEGFAWTNGIVIWALKEFGDRLTCPESC